jgi:hypothetical protein
LPLKERYLEITANLLKLRLCQSSIMAAFAHADDSSAELFNISGLAENFHDLPVPDFRGTQAQVCKTDPGGQGARADDLNAIGKHLYVVNNAEDGVARISGLKSDLKSNGGHNTRLTPSLSARAVSV